jgi:hypothetical protein
LAVTYLDPDIPSRSGGLSSADRILIVAHVDRDDIRIVSARKTTLRERKRRLMWPSIFPTSNPSIRHCEL